MTMHKYCVFQETEQNS